MRALIFSPEAVDHLSTIEQYISVRSSAKTAETFVNESVNYCQNLQQFPARGNLRNDLRPGLRLLGFRRQATIAFSVDPGTVAILGVFWGGRDVERWIGEHSGEE